MEKYKILERLGQGAFGKVYKALNKKTGETVAIKKFQQKYKTKQECMELREVRSLQKLKHPNITKLQEVLQEGNQLYLVFQYLEVNLFELYSKRKDNNQPFTEKQIKSLVFQILEGLAHMHKNGFFHRDMKPENLLVLGNVIKLCDFGLARQIRSMPPFTQYVSTRWYRAPQLLLSATNYNSPVDIFALGCIIAELYTFNPLFAGANAIDQMNKIVQVLGSPDEENWSEGFKLAKKRGYYFPNEKKQDLSRLIPNASDEAIDLITQTLQYNPKKRPKASQLLKHPFFAGVSNVAISASDEKKQVVFNQNLQPRPINTQKHDKKHQIMKLTKEKFFRNTKGNWNKSQNSPTKKYRQEQVKNEDQDLEAILKQLEREQQEKKAIKIRNSTKQYSNVNKPVVQMRESKTEMGYINPFRQQKQKEAWSFKKSFDHRSPEIIQKKQQTLPNQLVNKKLNYSFQPATLFPFALKPISKFQTYGRQAQPFKPSYPSYPNYPSFPNSRTNIFKQKPDGVPIVLKARSQLNHKFKF